MSDDKLREALQAARRFIRGRHSTISYGPQSLLEQFDIALGEKAPETALRERLEQKVKELRALADVIQNGTLLQSCTSPILTSETVRTIADALEQLLGETHK